ncbi:PucR family transcriptional regulator [Pseudalkalibacillus hwajinpoensis]|uniref:PucR family transcriptional regulator n=1 Tax=Guptibacillus hwajinpoensis TaxID=208199 RepID=UPI001CD223F6|nr:helix-turn-helix domain-containing protein [Pseudalkalibacillus hwajinpoensis]MCA0992110.1 helix-turn-helix domain-containing protein [Pseudalkalibacillus hwajinpoensis]
MHNDLENHNPFQGPFRTLEDLADCIRENLGCPVTIEDSDHRILAYSSHDENVDPARIATIMKRKVPEEVIKSLWKKGIIPQLFESDAPVIIPAIPEVGLGQRVAISVRKNEELLGFIWAQLNWEVTQEELALLKKAAKVVKNQILKLDIKKRHSEEGHREFFWKLLTGHYTKEEHIQQQASIYQLNVKGEMAIVIFEFSEEIQQSLERHMNYYIQASHQIELIYSTLDQNQLILLVRPQDPFNTAEQLTSFVQVFVEKISNRLGVDTLKGGAGALYQTPLSIKDSYREALHVLSIKERFKGEVTGIYSYQDLGIYQFIDLLYQERQHYQNPYIEKLKQYDAIHHTQLLETLATYLQQDSNVKAAALALHVHTNTLNYRLKRIADVANLDLKNANQKVTLFLDLKIEQMKS